MIVMLTAVFAQTFSSTPDIRASADPSIGSTFTIALGQSKISGLVHRAEIVDFGLEVQEQPRQDGSPTGTTTPAKLPYAQQVRGHSVFANPIRPSSFHRRHQ